MKDPKIPEGLMMSVLAKASPTTPAEQRFWEGMTRKQLADQFGQFGFKSATVMSKIRKMTRRGHLTVCECGEHVRPTQEGIDAATAAAKATR